jgi:hypothetical protein
MRNLQFDDCLDNRIFIGNLYTDNLKFNNAEKVNCAFMVPVNNNYFLKVQLVFKSTNFKQFEIP